MAKLLRPMCATETMASQLAALKEQVAKEKATSRENLKRVMKITQERKALELLLEERIAPAGSGGGGTSEAEVAALRAQAEQLQQQLSAKTLEAAELEEELEGAKEEVLYWKDEAEASAAQAKSLAAGTASQRQVADLEKRLAEARDSAAALSLIHI